MNFHAVRVGHTINAKALLLREGFCTAAQLETMNAADLDAKISERYAAVVLQAEADDYDDIYLIPKADFKSAVAISR